MLVYLAAQLDMTKRLFEEAMSIHKFDPLKMNSYFVTDLKDPNNRSDHTVEYIMYYALMCAYPGIHPKNMKAMMQ